MVDARWYRRSPTHQHAGIPRYYRKSRRRRAFFLVLNDSGPVLSPSTQRRGGRPRDARARGGCGIMAHECSPGSPARQVSLSAALVVAVSTAVSGTGVRGARRSSGGDGRDAGAAAGAAPVHRRAGGPQCDRDQSHFHPLPGRRRALGGRGGGTLLSGHLGRRARDRRSARRGIPACGAHGPAVLRDHAGGGGAVAPHHRHNARAVHLGRESLHHPAIELESGALAGVARDHERPAHRHHSRADPRRRRAADRDRPSRARAVARLAGPHRGDERPRRRDLERHSDGAGIHPGGAAERALSRGSRGELRRCGPPHPGESGADGGRHPVRVHGDYRGAMARRAPSARSSR